MSDRGLSTGERILEERGQSETHRMNLPRHFEGGLFLVKSHRGGNRLGCRNYRRGQGSHLFPSHSRDRPGDADGADRLTVRA